MLDASHFLPQNTKPFCPASIPRIDNPRFRLGLITDEPGQASITIGRAFSDKADELLFSVLEAIGITKSQTLRCYFHDDTLPNSQDSHQRLADTLSAWRPNALLYLCKNKTLSSFGFPERKLVDWRGSILCEPATIPDALKNIKVIPTYHPSEVLRVYDYMPFFKWDIRKAAIQSQSPDHNPINRVLEICHTHDDAIQRLAELELHPLIALDIEGYVSNMTCISFATSAVSAFTIPWKDYSDSARRIVLPALARVLTNPSIKKVLQNSLYDNFVLAYSYRIPILGVIHDTMLSGWEIYQELRKGLATQTSIWTDEPFYKFERKVEDDDTHYRYCARDSAVTYEICERHQAYLASRPLQRTHYNFNMRLLPPLLYMELTGIRYNQALAHEKLSEVEYKMKIVEERLRSIAGEKFNPRSPVQCNNLLYKKLGFPPQHPKNKNGPGTDKTKLTSDMDALLDILMKKTHPVILSLLSHRRLQKQHEQLSILCDPDGRVRTAYDVTGTETGRLSSRKSPTDSGFNLQTITKALRVLYMADEGYSMGQFDLSGADGWTVAAWCAKLGDDTMLRDYLEGIKPAKVIALMYRGAKVYKMTREELKQACKSVTDEGPDGWQYFACKQVQHGSNYLLGKQTMATNILKSSFKFRGEPIVVLPKDCEILQQLYLSRYPGVRRWQEHCKAQLAKTGELVSGCGNVRKFFGRRHEHQTLREYVAHEPQINTTFATNCALLKLWEDPENYDSSGLPIIRPVHQVHDALIAQWPEDKLDWASAKIKSYFQTPIIIAGYEITIPFEGGFGPNWKETTQAI